MTKLCDIFKISYGHKFDMNKMEVVERSEGVAFVGRKRNNEGLSGYVKSMSHVDTCPAGTLTVALGGSYLLSAYVQQAPFYTAQNVAVLAPIDNEMSLKVRLYYAMCIRHNRFRYSAFGREANRTLANLELPSALPEWVIKSEIPTHEGLADSVSSKDIKIQLSNWKEFLIGDLFDVKKGKRLTKAERKPGKTRFVGASEKNNGVTDYNGVNPNFDGGNLTIPYNGSVGWAFYQDKPFFACDDINVLEPKIMLSKWVLLFICTVLRHGKDKYTYGYKWTKDRMQSSKILLPSKDDESPNWELMESYMQSLPFSAILAELQNSPAKDAQL